MRLLGHQYGQELQYGQERRARGHEAVTAEMLLPLRRGLSSTSSGPVEVLSSMVHINVRCK